MGDNRDALVIVMIVADPLGNSAGALSSFGSGLDASLAPPFLSDGFGEDGPVCDGRQNRSRRSWMASLDAVNDLNWAGTLEDEVIDDDRKIKGLSDRVSRCLLYTSDAADDAPRV